jgi:hypothetical protein
VRSAHGAGVVTIDGDTWALRASSTLRALSHRRMRTGRRGLFGVRAAPLLGRRRFEHLWPFATTWSAAVTASTIPAGSGTGAAGDVVRHARALLAPFPRAAAAYRSPGSGYASSVVPPVGPGGDRYFDDNAWLGLAASRHFEVTGDPAALEVARDAWRFVAEGWSTEEGAVHPGGVRWKDRPASRARHACSTAPGAELAVLVHRHTGDEAALNFALAAYAWLHAALVDPSGLCFDHVQPDGRVDRTVWSYNQGSLVGAGLLLSEATGDRHLLAQATRAARAGRDHFGPELLVTQGAAFNAVYFRNVCLLAERAALPDVGRSIREAASGYAAHMWHASRDPRTGIFVGRGSPLGPTGPMLEILALLAGARPGP